MWYGWLKNTYERIRYRKNKPEYARKLGVRIGERCKIHANVRECFGSEPWLITIGDHVLIATGVHLITHDGGTFVFIDEYPKTNVLGPIRIGNNVYIGMNAIILPDVVVADNVIIAAGAVVTKNLESGWVYGGVPAKKIETVAEYKEKALMKSLETNGMTMEEKRNAIMKRMPQWFE